MQICSMQMIISHMCMMVCDPCNIATDAFVNPFHTSLHILKLWSPNNDKYFIFPCKDMSSNTLNYFLLLPSIQQDPIAPRARKSPGMRSVRSDLVSRIKVFPSTLFAKTQMK